MLEFILPLLGSYFKNNLMFSYWMVPVLALAFLATVPCIIRILIRR